MNGKFRFVFDWSDGRVMSERAYKMVKEDEAMAIREVSLGKARLNRPRGGDRCCCINLRALLRIILQVSISSHI